MTVEQWLGASNTLGIDIWKNKYQHNGEDFEQWLERVSNHDNDVAQLIRAKKFLPGGRILSNRGVTGAHVTYSNCYVVAAPEDNIESIYDSRKKLARTYSYGGGCGIDLSKLAPAGAKVRNQARATSGAVSFMEGYSKTTEEIGQNGRRGALMISLSCEHPDLPEFIDIKAHDGAVTKANISVRVTDEFMKAVCNNEIWTMEFKRPETGEVIKRVMPAAELFDKLCQNNWDWAEPGILFWDTIDNWNLLSNNQEFEYAGVNPCAEEPLPPGGSCLLGSINLAEFVDVSWGIVDYEELRAAVRIAVRCLNDVLDEGLPLHPLEEQRKTVEDWRQIGLGIMGLADMLIKLKLPYDSDEAIELCKDLSSFIADAALYESACLAKKRGPYTKYNPSVMDTDYFKYIASTATKEVVDMYGLRNSQILTIAPTGTLSTMLGISGGIEPIFANSYTRKTESLHKSEVVYKVYTPIVETYMKEHGITEEEELPGFFVTSATINPVRRVMMQAAWQKCIDASISSTVNLPETATVADVKDIYLNAWRYGLKGITVFRSGCKRASILTAGDAKQETECNNEPVVKNSNPKIERGYIIQCADDLIGKKRKLTTGCGSLHVNAFFDPVNGDLQEVYLSKGSTGGCGNFMTGLSRMISLACRAGVSIADIKDQLDSTGACPSYAARTATKRDTSKGACCPMAIGNALVQMQEEIKADLLWDDEEDDTLAPGTDLSSEDITVGTYNFDTKTIPESKSLACPVCGDPIFFEGGCQLCKGCGWSKCD